MSSRSFESSFGKHRAAAGTWLLLALVVSPAPALQAQTKPREPDAAEPRRWSEAELASAAEYGERLAGWLRTGSDEAVEAVDAEALNDAALAGVEADAGKLASFRAGMVKGFAGSWRKQLAQWRHTATFKRVVAGAGGELAVRLRCTGDFGICIVDFVLARRGDGWRVVDQYNCTIGIRMSEQLRQLAVPALANLDPGLLRRWFGKQRVKPADYDRFRQLMERRGAGDPAGVVALYAKLPEPLRETAAASQAYVEALGQTGAMDELAKALEQAAARHPAPMFRFALVDAHAHRRRWDAAIACIDEFTRAVEPDAAVTTLRALIQWQAGRVADARATLLAALEAEPDCEYAHATGLDVLLAAKDWPRVRESMQWLERTQRYDFRKVIADERWAEFRATDEAAPWR